MKVEATIYLNEGQLDELLEFDEPTALVEWLKHAVRGDWEEPSEVETLVSYLLEDRFTLDDGSCQVVDADAAESPALSGSFLVEYTTSCYLGCKDMDITADERDATLDFRIERELMQLIIAVEAPNPRYPCDEL